MWNVFFAASVYSAALVCVLGLVVADWFLRNVVSGFLRNILATHATFSSTIHELFGIRAPVAFRNEAIPAHRKKILKNVGPIFRRNFAPLSSVAVRPAQRGLPVEPVDFTEGLLAIGTGLALVPIVDHVPAHAVGFDLRQTFLSAISTLGPARALDRDECGACRTPLRGRR